MKVLTLLVGQDDGVIEAYFGVKHEGKLWLVPSWLIETATGFATPERMIRIDSFQESDGGKFDYLNIQLPKAVIEGVSQDTLGYEVRSLPDSPRVHRSDLYTLPSVFE
jgi:hypothetical protein